MTNPMYSIITTDDGSATIYSDTYAEAMHTTDGAYEEAVHKHVYLSGLLDLTIDEIWVLDVGFGLGYNVLALIMEIKKRNKNQKLRIVSFEKDRLYKECIQGITFNDDRERYYSDIKRAFAEQKAEFDGVQLEIHFGDARNSIKMLPNALFHGIFHDPFSPGKNPELWTIEFFTEIKRVLQEDGIVTTYSSAPQIRRAMLMAGLSVGRGPSFGKKKESTIAVKNIAILPNPDEMIDLQTLEKNVKSTPYEDPKMNASRDLILQTRIEKMREQRKEGKAS